MTPLVGEVRFVVFRFEDTPKESVALDHGILLPLPTNQAQQAQRGHQWRVGRDLIP